MKKKKKNKARLNKYSGLRGRILRVIERAPRPMTAWEVGWKIGTYQLDSIRPRFAELERMQLIESCGRRSCEHTGRPSKVWKATGLPGVPLVKSYKPSLKDQVRILLEQNSALKLQIHELQEQLNRKTEKI